MADKILKSFEVWIAAQGVKSRTRLRSVDNISLEGIARLRELILDFAIRGKLGSQNPSEVGASFLLDEIIRTSEQSPNTKRKSRNLRIPIDDSEKAFDLPISWEWARLSVVCSIERGITFPSSEKSKIAESGRIACLRTSNVQDTVEWDDLLYIREEFVRNENQFVQKDDIIISMANSRELVGKVALVDSQPEFRATIGGFLSIIRPKQISSRFLLTVLRAPLNRNTLINSASQTTNIANISLAKLEPLVIAIPPLAEQHRIVAKVEELMALCDELEKQETHHLKSHALLVETLLGALTQAKDAREFQQAWSLLAQHFDDLFTTEDSIDQLKQTILQLAVMGKLVPQDPKEVVSEVFEKNEIHFDSKSDQLALDIPRNWKAVFVEQCFEIKSGSTVDVSKELGTGNYMYLKVGDLNLPGNEKEITVSSRYINPNDKELRAVIPSGSIVFPKRGGAIATNKKKIVRSDIFVDLNIMAISPRNGIDLHYAFYWLQGIDLAMLNSGTSVPQINHKDIGPLVFPLPPLNEQQRIVSKVNELFALCDDLKARLAAAQTLANQMAEGMVG
ncbi:MAG: restriction endonuclease subunit S [Cyclobacteriaceae bacterium]|jgi:type I restriction enzyme S subunit